MKLLYTLIYLAFLPLAVPWLLYRIVFRGKYRESLWGMTGRRMPAPNPVDKRRTFWLHAVSVGEVNAAAAMVRELEAAYPEARLVVSTTTETGQAHARKTLGARIDDVFYYPLDFPWLVRAFLDRVRPTDFILLETELWPNMLLNAAERGVRIAMMNGKLSPKSHRRYMRFRFLFKKPLTGVSAFCMQTDVDAERMIQLAGRPEAVRVTGNCKFDTPMPALPAAERDAWRARWGLNGTQPVVVVGSTHAGEEEFALEAFARVSQDAPDAAFVICPRHPERFDEVAERIAQSGRRLLRASTGETPGQAPEIVLLDQMGRLQQAYGLGEIAVVAGSFVYSEKFGGHNLLEPAVHGVPVVYGPHMHKQTELLRLFADARAGIQVDGCELGEALAALLDDAERRRRLADRARGIVEANKGCARRNVELLQQLAGACKASEY